MKTQLLYTTTFASLLLTSLSISALAAPATNCYRLHIEMPQLAEDHSTEFISEIWCYEKLQGPKNELFIYNADTAALRPELTLLKESSGEVVHGSLLQGSVSYHRASKTFNPFSIPLEEPTGAEIVRPIDIKININSARQALERLKFYSEQTKRNPSADFILSPGELMASVSPEDQPWRGYWWPQRNLPITAPLKKLDKVILQSTGVAGQSAVWESQRHRWGGASWEGHCNGWAASSVLRKEPQAPRFDVASGVTFSVSDQKGMLAEKDYCANVAFFGSRYRGVADNQKDIRPEVFHKTLLYYIGNLKKPVAMDYHSGTVVDNHVVSAYKMTISQLSETSFTVNAVLSVHRYDKNIIEVPGTAPIYERKYKYTLYTNEQGVPTSGVWATRNPDFLWVPLSPTTCKSGNPNVTEAWIQQIIYK